MTVLLADEEHVAAGSLEQGGEDGTGSGGAVVAEDALVGDASGDGHAGLAGDIAEDLVEAGVIGGDGELTLRVSDELRGEVVNEWAVKSLWGWVAAAVLRVAGWWGGWEAGRR